MPKEPPKIKGTGTQARVPKQAKERALNNSAFTRAVNSAARKTDWNDHTGARRTLSKFFKYDDLTKRYDDVSKRHEEAGHLTSELYETRSSIDNEMYDRIRRDYGEDTLRKARRGL